jgi:hypothetical protein
MGSRPYRSFLRINIHKSRALTTTPKPCQRLYDAMRRSAKLWRRSNYLPICPPWLHRAFSRIPKGTHGALRVPYSRLDVARQRACDGRGPSKGPPCILFVIDSVNKPKVAREEGRMCKKRLHQAYGNINVNSPPYTQRPSGKETLNENLLWLATFPAGPAHSEAPAGSFVGSRCFISSW